MTWRPCQRAAELDSSILRSLDALPLAGALTIGDELDRLVTYDERLTAAAALHGVAVVAPRLGPEGNFRLHSRGPGRVAGRLSECYRAKGNPR